MDLKLNGNFDVQLDDRHDLATVDGRAEFEQSVAMRVVAYFHSAIGNIHRDNVLELLELEARRAAENTDEIERVVQFRAEYAEDQPGQVNVTIIYDTGDEFTFSVTE